MKLGTRILGGTSHPKEHVMSLNELDPAHAYDLRADS